jgi:putative tricarboxylic transport membrane protein
MQEIQSLMGGFAVALSWFNLMLMFAGIVLGVIIGVLPGLGGANGVAILLPLTFSMAQQPGGATSAIILLSCIYWGALFGGAITSILFNIPGEPWSVATTFDGYPLAQKGQAGAALTAAFTSSFVGALVAVILITFLSPIVARFALRFGPPEFFSVYLLTFCAFVGMSKGSPFKTIAAMMAGFALAAVGIDTVTGQLRLTFGFESLLKGFDFLIAVIGLFGIGEILLTIEEGLEFRGARAKLNMRVVIETWRELPKYWKTSLRSSAVGCMMGIVPGGATPASFMSYGLAKKMSRDGDKFGTGQVEGVVAPETAAHAAGTSALLPMLTLGVPGSPTAAVLLGGLMIWGLQPGPLLFVEKPDFVWGLIASMYLGNIVGLVVVLTCVPLFDRRVHRAQLDVRRVADAGVRRDRLRVQEARLSARAPGPGAGARRPRGGLVPPVDAALPGRHAHLLRQWPRGHDHHALPAPLVLAVHLQGNRRLARPQGLKGRRACR